MKRYALVIGRFQPLHAGHVSLIRRLLDEGEPVEIAMMDTEIDEMNPYTFEERTAMIENEFASDDLRVRKISPISQVCYGRNVGYHIRRIFHEKENVSASEIRSGKEAFYFYSDEEFLNGYLRVAEKVHQLMGEQGFWRDGKQRNKGEMLAHAHSELSEAFECMRMGNPPDKNIHDMSGAEVQLSDVLGILMDFEMGFGFKIAEALLKKMEFNKSRGYLHGKEF